MRLKFVILVFCVGLFSTAAFWIAPAWTPAYQVAATAPRIDLLPRTLAGARQQTHWRNHLKGTVVENGAIYGPVSGTHITLDFFRGRSRQHNGIACFVARGNTLDTKHTQTLQTAVGHIEFTLAVLESRSGPRIIASTQCTAQECGPGRAIQPRQHVGLDLRMQDLLSRAASVVPVTVIVMPVDGMDGAEVDEGHLRHVLRRAVATLDLRPAQRLAAVQQGLQGINPKKLAQATATVPNEPAK